MCEEININVQENNDIVNIVSSEVTEVIDINVSENTEQVTFNVTEEIIQVNINKVTNVSAVTSVNGETGDVILDIPTNTSDLINDSGFITSSEIPSVNDASSSIKGILKLTNDLGGTADLPTVPALANKVDKVSGKGLSTEDYTTTEKNKLAGIEAGAEVNVNADWNATSGDAQILNKPNFTNGTAGQILAKNSATNYDWSWIDNFTEDIRDTVKATQSINKGQAVYISGANGTNQLVSKADYSAENTSSQTIGIASKNFAINDIGQVITQGILSGIDTSSASSAGSPIYLGANGNLIFDYANKPSAPYHLVYIGVVTRKHSINGEIYINISNGWELDELHNVAISSVADKQLLSYDNATSLWKNKSVTTADINDSLNKRYVTDANLTTIGNQSGSNTGDETTATIKSKLGIASTSTDGYLTSIDWSTFNNKATKTTDISGIEDDNFYDLYIRRTLKYVIAKSASNSFDLLRAGGPITTQNITTNYSSEALLFATTATAGNLSFFRGSAFYNLNNNIFKFQPNAVSNDARYFVGFSNMYLVTAPTNIEPTTMTNCVGVGKLSTSNNLFIILNDATGTATNVDLGSNFPANSSLYTYNIKITSTNITIRRTTISNGTILDYSYTVTSDYPSVGICPALWICNNGSAVINSLYFYSFASYSN